MMIYTLKNSARAGVGSQHVGWLKYLQTTWVACGLTL